MKVQCYTYMDFWETVFLKKLFRKKDLKHGFLSSNMYYLFFFVENRLHSCLGYGTSAHIIEICVWDYFENVKG